MNRPRLLDACCKAGGTAMGYHRAGFEVVGIDLEPQPHFPFRFVQADVLEVLTDDDFLDGVGDGYPDLIGPVRELLSRNYAGPYVIENVPGAPLHNPTQLCGSSFKLDVRRHRLFCQRNTDIPRSHCQAHAHQLEKKQKAAPIVERDPETQAVHDRHPNIKQKPLPVDGGAA